MSGRCKMLKMYHIMAECSFSGQSCCTLQVKSYWENLRHGEGKTLGSQRPSPHRENSGFTGRWQAVGWTVILMNHITCLRQKVLHLEQPCHFQDEQPMV